MPATPPNPDQKDQPPWQERLQDLWRDRRYYVSFHINQVNEKIWVLDDAVIRFKKRVFNLLDKFSLRVKKFPRNRPALIFLCILPFVLAVIFLFRGVFIIIFPLSAIAIAPFFLSFWHATLALGLLAISGLAFFLFGLQFLIYLAQIVSSVWFLFLLFLGFVIALYHPPLAGSVLSIVTEEKSGPITPFVPAIATILGLLLFAQRLDVMNEQVEATQDQHESEQFKQACELLAHKNMVTRLGGITLLGALAQTNPDEWHITVVNVLAHFIRERSMNDESSPVKWLSDFLVSMEEREGELNEKEAEEKWQKLSESKANRAPADIEAAIRVIACDLTGKQKNVIKKHHRSNKCWPDLSKSWLCKINLTGAYLPKAILSESFFTRTNLDSSDLSDAIFTSSHLDKTSLIDTNLQDILFNFTNLAGTDISTAKGLGYLFSHDAYDDDDYLENSNLLKTKERKKDIPANFYHDCYYIEGEALPNLIGRVTPLGRFEEITPPNPMKVEDYWKNTRNRHK